MHPSRGTAGTARSVRADRSNERLDPICPECACRQAALQHLECLLVHFEELVPIRRMPRPPRESRASPETAGLNAVLSSIDAGDGRAPEHGELKGFKSAENRIASVGGEEALRTEDMWVLDVAGKALIRVMLKTTYSVRMCGSLARCTNDEVFALPKY